MLDGVNIRLQPVITADAALIATWFNDAEYMGPFNNVWPTTTREWERNLTERRTSQDEGMFLILGSEDGEPKGLIGYFGPHTMADFFRGVEIWYQVHPRFRGQGIATQAAALLVNHLFDATPLERIQATVAVGNDASCRVVEAAGLRCEGILRRITFLHGRYVDMYLYSIVRSDWGDELTYRVGRRPF
jgi:RimJ/RimL family protein N-acetyltransferase